MFIKIKGHEIYASNLCTEIMLPSNEDWSFVCCLSSINLLHYDKWKDTDAVETLNLFLRCCNGRVYYKARSL